MQWFSFGNMSTFVRTLDEGNFRSIPALKSNYKDHLHTTLVSGQTTGQRQLF